MEEPATERAGFPLIEEPLHDNLAIALLNWQCNRSCERKNHVLETSSHKVAKRPMAHESLERNCQNEESVEGIEIKPSKIIVRVFS